MDKVDSYILTPVENALLKVGIDSAGKAGVVAAALTAGTLFFVKPSSMFDRDGRPRPWSMFTNTENPTPVTWWLASAGIGWGISLFI